jgi:hypothetical protein
MKCSQRLQKKEVTSAASLNTSARKGTNLSGRAFSGQQPAEI